MRTPPSARRRVLTATLTAAAVAAVVLVVAILPAEYGIDPLGTGRRLGLAGLANPPAPPASPSGAPATARALQSDVFEIELRPFDSVEYKYRLEAGDGMVFSWKASEPVTFDFHGEADGTKPKDAESYVKGTGGEGQGTFTAARSGIHGWYWKNNRAGRVKVTLRTSGFYSRATLYYDGERTERRFDAR